MGEEKVVSIGKILCCRSVNFEKEWIIFEINLGGDF